MMLSVDYGNDLQFVCGSGSYCTRSNYSNRDSNYPNAMFGHFNFSLIR